MKKHLLIAGHGGSDVGAVGNGTNERDFTRQVIVPKVAAYIKGTKGHDVTVYRTHVKCMDDTLKGGGLHWAKKEGFDTATEFHLDAFNGQARGGHVIIASGLVADSIDKGIAQALEKYVGVRYGGLNHRNNLYQVNTARNIGLNFRLVELGFIDNKADMDAINKNVDTLCKAIAESITGKEAKSRQPIPRKTVKKAPKKVKQTSSSTRTVGKTYTSVVDYLSDHGINSSFANRRKLASKHGIRGYVGTAQQNIRLLNALQNGGGKAPTKSYNEIAREVIYGKWGTGRTRKRALQKVGYNYRRVQNLVNRML